MREELLLDLLSKQLVKRVEKTLDEIKRTIFLVLKIGKMPRCKVKSCCKDFERWLRFEKKLSEKTARNYANAVYNLLANNDISNYSKTKTALKHFLEFLRVRYLRNKDIVFEEQVRKQLRLTFFNLG